MPRRRRSPKKSPYGSPRTLADNDSGFSSKAARLSIASNARSPNQALRRPVCPGCRRVIIRVSQAASATLTRSLWCPAMVNEALGRNGRAYPRTVV